MITKLLKKRRYIEKMGYQKSSLMTGMEVWESIHGIWDTHRRKFVNYNGEELFGLKPNGDNLLLVSKNDPYENENVEEIKLTIFNLNKRESHYLKNVIQYLEI